MQMDFVKKNNRSKMLILASTAILAILLIYARVTPKIQSASIEKSIEAKENKNVVADGSNDIVKNNISQEIEQQFISKNNHLKKTNAYPAIRNLDKELPKENYANLIPNLRERAANGDPKDAYILGRVLADCLSINKGLGDGLSPEDAKADRCSNVVVKDSSEIRKWLAFAAEHGSLDAQLLYANEADLMISPEEMIKNPDNIEEYKNNSIHFLEYASSEGSTAAMLMLSSVYDKGVMTDRNILLAYAYRYAALNMEPAGTIDDPSIVYNENVSQRFIDEARRIGQQISSGRHN